MKVLSKSENKIQFVADGITSSIANSIRRAAMFQVPTLAIEHVYFSENNSCMYDEQIAIRLGLVAIKCDTSKYNIPSECKCKGEGCNKCQVKLSLNVKGPRMVLASDLKVEGAEILYPETPIVWLEESQKIELTAGAVLGLGEEHAKWNTGIVFYQHYPKIKIEDKAKAKEGAKHCPRGVFDGAEISKIENCNLCKACEDYSNGAIEIKEVEDKFIFTVESFGQLDPKDIFTKAIEIVQAELDGIKLK